MPVGRMEWPHEIEIIREDGTQEARDEGDDLEKASEMYVRLRVSQLDSRVRATSRPPTTGTRGQGSQRHQRRFEKKRHSAPGAGPALMPPVSLPAYPFPQEPWLCTGGVVQHGESSPFQPIGRESRVKAAAMMGRRLRVACDEVTSLFFFYFFFAYGILGLLMEIRAQFDVVAATRFTTATTERGIVETSARSFEPVVSRQTHVEDSPD